MIEIYRPQAPLQWGWIALKGPDAADFLHRLTTVHVKAMKPGEGAPGFLLTAQGKMRAYFQLWMISREEFFFEVDAGSTGKWKQDLLATLDQFHFGEKLTIEPGGLASDDALAGAWIFTDRDEGFPATYLFSDIPSGIRLFNHGDRDFGRAWISAWGPRAGLESWTSTLAAKAIGLDEVETLRIQAARPRIDAELSENTIPLEAGLRDAISDNKGCYPGQEVIERIISLGSPARRLVRLEGTGGAPSPGEALQFEGREVGTVTSVATREGGFQALAFVKKMHAQEGIEVTLASHPDARAKVVFITPYA